MVVQLQFLFWETLKMTKNTHSSLAISMVMRMWRCGTAHIPQWRRSMAALEVNGTKIAKKSSIGWTFKSHNGGRSLNKNTSLVEYRLEVKVALSNAWEVTGTCSII
jgi:hypothetical protein